MRRSLVILAISILLASLATPLAPTFAQEDKTAKPNCVRTTIAVSLSPTAPTTSNVVGWLCRPTRNVRGDAIQLLVSGATYDHHYWDMPVDGDRDRYSYVQRTTRAGFAVLTIDRLGVGESDQPPSEQLTVPVHAWVVHQIVQDLRNGKIGGTKFRTIIGVGHSLGSSILVCEAGSPSPQTAATACPGYGDLDAIILTGWLHQPNAASQAASRASMHPAAEDPILRFRHQPSGYMTTRPGTRIRNYYNPAYADTRIVAADERLKQTVTTGELATINLPRDPIYSRAIRVPVLIVVGAMDTLVCDGSTLPCFSGAAVSKRESPHFSVQAQLRIMVVPKAGHNTALHPNAPHWSQLSNRWAASLRHTYR